MDWFFQIATGPFFKRSAMHLLICKGGHHDDRSLGSELLHLWENVEPRQARHLDIGNDEIEGLLDYFTERVRTVTCTCSLKSFLLKKFLEQGSHLLIILDDENVSGAVIFNDFHVRSLCKRVAIRKKMELLLFQTDIEIEAECI